MRVVLVPMMGRGERFRTAGYTDPKPFINVKGRAVLEHVLDHLPEHDRLVIVARKEYEAALHGYPGDHLLLEGETRGATDTVLRGAALIDPASEVLIVNCDNFVEVDWGLFIQNQAEARSAASVLTFTATEEKYSFVRVDGEGFVVEAAEKRPISDRACAGYFWFRSCMNMKTCLQAYLKAGDGFRVNGEFYLTPALNFLKHLRVTEFPVARFVDLGTPQEVARYEAS